MTTKTSVVRQLAGMRLQATTGSGFEIGFDSGQGQQAAGPTEVLLSALAACTAMDVVSILAKKRQRYDRYEVQVRAEQRDDYPQVFTRIELTHEIEGPNLVVAAVRRSIELSATKYCPISAMLSAGDTEIHHGYRVIGRGEPAFEESGEVIVTGPARWPEVLR
ncbi:MAG: OsmC family protein, partial [Candidatus Limnocylindrales bacterium]